MKKKISIYLSLFIFLFVFLFTSYLTITNHKLSSKFNDIEHKEEKSEKYLQKLDTFGYVNIFNITLNKIIAEVGENVTVSSVYSFLCNEGYEREYGKIGINRLDWTEWKNSLNDDVAYHNVTETFSINPLYYDALDDCRGRVEIKIRNIFDYGNYKIYSNLSEQHLEIRRANLNYSLINQYPLTVFSEDLLNFTFLIYNEHTKNYIYSNSNINIDIINANKSLKSAGITNSNGYLNFMVNCSSLGAGNYTIQLRNNETIDYECTSCIIQLEVFEEESCINFTLLNDGEVYTNVNYDDSNFSKAIFLIECHFAANISFISDFGNGQCSIIENQCNLTISSPDIAGLHQIQFLVQPMPNGKLLKFNRTLDVKIRPIELIPTFYRYEKQSQLNCYVNILDKLVNKTIMSKNVILISTFFNASNWSIGSVECNSSGIAIFEWKIPNSIIDDYISFNFKFDSTPVYQFSSITKNVTIPKIEYSGPFQAYSSTNITIRGKLNFINGTAFSNQFIELRLNGKILNLTTNLNGEISYSFITPSYATNLKIEMYFQGSNNLLSTTLITQIEIKIDLLHRIWNSSGFLLIGLSAGIILIIYLKKNYTKHTLINLKVN